MGIAGFDGVFVRVNPAFTRVLGHSAEAIMSRPFLDFVHVDDREATLAQIGSLSSGAPTVDFENRYQCADGTYRWLAWHAQPVVEEQRIYAVARDVTEAQATAAALVDREARLRAVFEGAGDGLITLNDGGVIEACNAACASIFGYSAADLVGRNVTALMPGSYAGEPGESLARYLRTGERPLGGTGPREMVGQRADGGTFPMEVALSEIRLAQGRTFLGSIRDITDRQRLEQERSMLLAREAMERGRLEFSAGILHDLGNVLTGIAARARDVRGALALAEASNELPRTARFVRAQRDALAAALGEPRADALAEILEGIDRASAKARAEIGEGLMKLSTFVEHAQDLLATHRSQSGGARGARQTSVANVLMDLHAMFSDRMAARGGRLDLRCPPDLRGVQVDTVRVLRALINGAQNAMEAFDAEPSGGGFQLSLTIERPARERLRFTLTDNGPGFSGDGETYFEDGATTRTRSSGLGLGATRRTIASLGGTVRLSSEGRGRGAAFVVTIPWREEVA